MTRNRVEFYVEELKQFFDVSVGLMGCTDVANNAVWVGRYNAACRCVVAQGSCVLFKESVDRNFPFFVGYLEDVVQSLGDLGFDAEPIE